MKLTMYFDKYYLKQILFIIKIEEIIGCTKEICTLINWPELREVRYERTFYVSTRDKKIIYPPNRVLRRLNELSLMKNHKFLNNNNMLQHYGVWKYNLLQKILQFKKKLTEILISLVQDFKIHDPIYHTNVFDKFESQQLLYKYYMQYRELRDVFLFLYDMLQDEKLSYLMKICCILNKFTIVPKKNIVNPCKQDDIIMINDDVQNVNTDLDSNEDSDIEIIDNKIDDTNDKKNDDNTDDKNNDDNTDDKKNDDNTDDTNDSDSDYDPMSEQIDYDETSTDEEKDDVTDEKIDFVIEINEKRLVQYVFLCYDMFSHVLLCFDMSSYVFLCFDMS